LQFGLWRAFSDRVGAEKDPTASVKDAGSRLLKQSDTRPDVPLHTWSRDICNRIVGYDQDVLGKLSLGSGPGRLDMEAGMREVSVSVENKDHRDVEVAATVLSGFHPTGGKKDYEKYVFVDAASASKVVKGGERALVELKVQLPRLPRGAEIFVWELPFLDEALVAARYASPPRPPPSCSEAWAKAPGSVGALLLDLVRLAAHAPDRFADVTAKESSAFGTTLGIQKSLIPVRGALKSEIYGGSEPSAVVTLYEGPSKTEAVEVFELAATAMENACKDLPRLMRRWASKSDGNPNLRVDRLTAFSEAVLVVSTRVPEDNKKDEEVSHRVYWSLRRSP
jgi:hypothetical protein